MAEPLGERIIVQGRVLDEDGKPVPNALVEIWQCNAAGRYHHPGDQHDAPLDPNFYGGGRARADAEGQLPVHHHQARRLSVEEPPQRLAAGAHPFLAVRAGLRHAPDHADVLPQRSAARPTTRSTTRCPTGARERLQAPFDMDLTQPEWALGYRFDIVLRGRNATPME